MANQQKSPFANALTGVGNSMSTEVESPSSAPGPNPFAEALMRSQNGGEMRAEVSNSGANDFASRFAVPEGYGPGSEQAGPTPEELAEQERDAKHLAALKQQEQREEVFNAREQQAQMDIEQIRIRLEMAANQSRTTRNNIAAVGSRTQVYEEGTIDGSRGTKIWIQQMILYLNERAHLANSSAQWAKEAEAKKAKKGPRGADHGKGLKGARGFEVTTELHDVGDENWVGKVSE